MSKQSETRIELLVDAIDDFVRETILEYPKAATPTLSEARTNLANALREFLKPMLRLVDEGPRQPDDAVTCRVCFKQSTCKPDCVWWHRSIKADRDAVVAPPTVPPHGGDRA